MTSTQILAEFWLLSPGSSLFCNSSATACGAEIAHSTPTTLPLPKFSRVQVNSATPQPKLHQSLNLSKFPDT